MKDKHTETPWEVAEFHRDRLTILREYPKNGDEVGTRATLIAETRPGRAVDGVSILTDKDKANAKRIVICVNALDGISNKALESGVVGEMVDVIKNIVAQFRKHSWYPDDYEDLFDPILAKLEGNDG